MGWNAGADGYTWNAGNGIKRKTVVGPCRCVLPGGATHMMRFNDIGSFLGIEWKEQTRWLAGWFSPETGFTTAQASDEATWNSCWANINCTPQPAPPTEQPTTDPTVGWASTPLTESIDWRVALAALLIVSIIVFYLIKNR